MSGRVRLPGALAVVTGAGGGIGRATALALAARGCRVVAVDVDGVAAKATAADCGGEAEQVDVADRDAMAALADRVGTPEVLVNNAGVGLTGRFLDTTDEDWDWVLSVNLRGVVHGCQVFGPGMVARGRGQVVNVSSGLAYSPRATEPAYVTTKAAVLALSQCLRADWGPSGVGVSVVCPGVIDTGIIAATRFRGTTAERRARVQRLFSKGHSPDLVAGAIVGAVDRDRPVVPVGVEAVVGWGLHRLAPARLVDRMARTTFRGV
ncbi:MAG TPA: SDR family NAD(P)-dependent oxidoreductase [Acidimicrobiales bacterium]|nr:SDR family NAD(P)-dependent oxidoreductase [Acidimicrobiales bacterium]